MTLDLRRLIDLAIVRYDRSARIQRALRARTERRALTDEERRLLALARLNRRRR
jgi:hypothetical protein